MSYVLSCSVCSSVEDSNFLTTKEKPAVVHDPGKVGCGFFWNMSQYLDTHLELESLII